MRKVDERTLVPRLFPSPTHVVAIASLQSAFQRKVQEPQLSEKQLSGNWQVLWLFRSVPKRGSSCCFITFFKKQKGKKGVKGGGGGVQTLRESSTLPRTPTHVSVYKRNLYLIDLIFLFFFFLRRNALLLIVPSSRLKHTSGRLIT